MSMRMQYGMSHVSCMLLQACSFVHMHHGMRRSSVPRFLRMADFGHSWKARHRDPAGAVASAWHARMIDYITSSAHAAFDTARARGEHAWDRFRPRLRPGSSLPSGTAACSMHIFACTLCCMTCNIVTDVHAAWHALTRGCRLARPELRAGSLNVRCTRLTVSDD